MDILKSITCTLISIRIGMLLYYLGDYINVFSNKCKMKFIFYYVFSIIFYIIILKLIR